MALAVVLDNGSATDNGAGVAYVTASFTPAANKRYLLGLVYAHASVNAAPPSTVTHAGTGLTITRREDIAYKTSGTNRTGMAVYSVDAGPSVSGGTFSITFTLAMVGCGWTVVDLDTYAAIWANKGEISGIPATPSGTLTVNLPAAPTDTPTSRAIYFLSSNGIVGWTVEAGWTELQETAQINPSITRMVAWNASAWDASAVATNAAGSSGAAAGMIAVELFPMPPDGLLPARMLTWDDGTVSNAVAAGGAIEVVTGTNTYTSDAIHGGVAARHSPGQVVCLYTSLGLTNDGAGQCDMYWQPETVAGAPASFFQFASGAGGTGLRGAVRTHADGKVEIVDSSLTRLAATTGTWTEEQWHRFTIRWTARVSSNYTVTVRVYWTAESTTYEEISATVSTSQVITRLTFGANESGRVSVTDTIRVYTDLSAWPEPVNPSTSQDEDVTAAASSTGTATGTATPTHTVTAAASSTGTATSTAVPAQTATVTALSTGTATGTAVPRHVLTATASSTGTGTASIAGGPQSVTAAASSTGTATATATPRHIVTWAASATGTGTAAVAAHLTLTATGSSTGTGTATIVVGVTLTVAATSEGTATAVVLNPLTFRDITLTARRAPVRWAADDTGTRWAATGIPGTRAASTAPPTRRAGRATTRWAARRADAEHVT